MSRYTGPKWRVSRAANFPIFDNEDYKKRQSKPGQHGSTRPNNTAYAQQFAEKQKVKKSYGMNEKQFQRFFKVAQGEVGNTGAKLLELLERRLDNVVYRLKLAKSRPAARQLVAHGNVTVNGKKLDIPSYIVQSGDEIEIKKSISEKEWFKFVRDELKSSQIPAWLEELSNGGKMKTIPTRDMMDKAFDEQLIVEFYSR